NAKHDVRVKELEQKNTELEARLAIVEQSSVAVDGQSKNDKEAIAKQSAPSSCIYSNVEIKVEVESTEKCFAEDSSSDNNSIPDYSQEKQDQSLPSCVSDQKSLMDREIDTFLDDAHKKSVSDGISLLKVLPSAENNLTVSSGNDKIESSTKTVSSGNDQMVSQKLEKIEKTSRNQQKEMLEHLAGVTPVALRIKTLRAKKIRKLFGENGVGIDKIKCINCSANEISKLTNKQIQNVIDQVTSESCAFENHQW
ncbi:hypothetical protein RhiirC2_792988, partial [Rhizophagus irregularis]